MSYDYFEPNQSATIHTHATESDWNDLCVDLSHNKVNSLYFHYSDYSSKEHSVDLLKALARATDLKDIIIKGSTFNFQDEDGREGLEILLEALHKQPNLEHLTIRNFNETKLNMILDNLTALLDENKAITKLSFEHQTFNTGRFLVLCNQLARLDRKFELELKWYIELSEENKSHLRKVLAKNPLITVTALPSATVLQKLEKTPSIIESNLDSLLQGASLLSASGVVAVIIAFTLLNAATGGTAGLVVASLGAASLVAGLGMFAYSFCKNDITIEEEVDILNPQVL